MFHSMFPMLSTCFSLCTQIGLLIPGHVIRSYYALVYLVSRLLVVID